MSQIRSSLKYIEVENFKSYKGALRIGPLKNFSAVIGPNSSGKSNFMDAVSFVMGEKATTLRVKRLSDLIHGASINKAIRNKATVSAIFELEDKTELKFTRIVSFGLSEYRFNDEMVNPSRYFAELEKLGILKQSKMEDIIIAMSRGNMEDIEQDGNATESMNNESVSTGGTDSVSTMQSSQTIYEREERIVIDYSRLPDKYKNLVGEDEVRREGDRLQRHVNELSSTIQRIEALNMRAMQKLDLAREKLHETNEEFEKARVKTKKAKQAFKRVKKEQWEEIT